MPISVRRQAYGLGKTLWLVWFVMLCGFRTVQQAAVADCLSFDPFSSNQNGLLHPKLEVGGPQDVNTLMAASVAVVSLGLASGGSLA
jgi:hypothetical protein